MAVPYTGRDQCDLFHEAIEQLAGSLEAKAEEQEITANDLQRTVDALGGPRDRLAHYRDRAAAFRTVANAVRITEDIERPRGLCPVFELRGIADSGRGEVDSPYLSVTRPILNGDVG